LKKEFIKKCSSQISHILPKFIYFFIILFLLNIKNLFAENDCFSEKDIKIGLLENEFIDYSYYLYYELGNYTKNRNIEFKLDLVDNNIDDFDIIFGEWYDLKKLNLIKTKFPSEIKNFYMENGLLIENNLLPLDLDTFILLSKSKEPDINLITLSNFIHPVRYTIGLSILSSQNFINILGYSSGEEFLDLYNPIIESTLNSFRKLYVNLNKNTLFANHLEMFQSFEDSENVYTVFNDGILLYDDIEYDKFQLMPQNSYKWIKEKGLFEKKEYINPYSFYGLSAYINNDKGISFICHIIKQENRLKAFKDFNIGLSPLSFSEIESIDGEIEPSYKEILLKKNKFILDMKNKDISKKYNIIESIFINKIDYENSINSNNYLSKSN